MNKHYKLGNLNFIIRGNDVILPHLSQELSAIESLENKTVDLIFEFATPQSKIDKGIHVSPIICSENEVIYNHRDFKYHLKAENKAFKITIKSKKLHRKIRISPKVEKILDQNFLDPSQLKAKNFMYNIFDHLTQIKNIARQQTYFHASSFCKNNKGVAVVAWGGVGKTTAMLQMVLKDDWKFLSDDLGVIDTNGIMYRSPKKMQIYAYNIENQPHLKKRLLSNRSVIDRLNWHEKRLRYGIKKARRRVSAEKLFGEEQVAEKATLTHGFFIERANIDNFETYEISSQSLAFRATKTVMDEIRPFQKIESAIYSAQKQNIIPTSQQLFETTREIMEKAFSNAQLKLVKIPLKASPEDLADHLKKMLNS